MKIAFFEIKEDWEKKAIKKAFSNDDVFLFEKKINEVNLSKLKSVDVISIFIYSKCNEEILKKIPKLKLVATRSTGFDHIDLDYCKKKSISVCNVPHYGENTVAEFTIALLLNITRNLNSAINRVKTGIFNFEGLRGFDLSEKTIGIVGFGNIGQKFAKICKGFEMNVIVYDINSKKLSEKGKKLGVEFVSLKTIFKKSDIISLHIPALPSTRHILNEKSFEIMKKGVIILNTSRGELIDTKALLNAIISKKIFGVGLDVLEGECMIKEELELFSKNSNEKFCNTKLALEDHILINLPNVFVTPHNAFNTIDALERILNTTLENIKKFEIGKLQNTVKIR